MKVWKVIELYCCDEELEDWLNQFESEGKVIKEIMYVAMSTYKIIYTVENIEE
jgi:hypothetical protein